MGQRKKELWRLLQHWLLVLLPTLWQRLRQKNRRTRPYLVVTNPHSDRRGSPTAVRHLRLVHSNRDEMRQAL